MKETDSEIANLEVSRARIVREYGRRLLGDEDSKYFIKDYRRFKKDRFYNTTNGVFDLKKIRAPWRESSRLLEKIYQLDQKIGALESQRAQIIGPPIWAQHVERTTRRNIKGGMGEIW